MKKVHRAYINHTFARHQQALCNAGGKKGLSKPRAAYKQQAFFNKIEFICKGLANGKIALHILARSTRIVIRLFIGIKIKVKAVKRLIIQSFADVGRIEIFLDNAGFKAGAVAAVRNPGVMTHGAGVMRLKISPGQSVL